MNLTLGNQKGVYLPIAAIAIIGVLVIVIGLGIESSQIKHASADLRLKTEEICKEVAYNPIITINAISSFRSQVQDLLGHSGNPRRLPSYLKINKARLIIPTMLASSPTPGTRWIGSLTGAPCTLDGSPPEDCEFLDSIDEASGEYPTNPPGAFWDNLNNAGNTVACELSGTVETLFSSLGITGLFQSQQRDIVAKTVWWRPERVNSTNSTPLASGLTIAVATEVQTKGWDRRFRFQGPTFHNSKLYYTYDTVPNYPPFLTAGVRVDNESFADLYDPLLNFQTADPVPIPGIGRAGFGRAQSPLRRPYGGTTFLEYPQYPYLPVAPVATDPGLSSNSGGGQPRWVYTNPNAPYDNRYFPCSLGDPLCPNPGPDATQSENRLIRLSDREEMLAACMNPVVLVRNVFLSTIVELASRHGRLRNDTEILHINPQHRMAGVVGSGLPPPNNPAIIVPFGGDLVDRNYQLPFVSFYSGDNGTPSSLRPHKGGWINPFTSADPGVQSGDPQWVAHHALVASQLRYCYHLYQGFNTPNGVDAGLNRFAEEVRYDVANAGFEPATYQWPEDPSVTTTGENLPLSHRYPSASGEWDQNCPWNGAACAGTLGNRSLSAAEVVSALGSTQRCPYMQDLRGAAAPVAELKYDSPASLAATGHNVLVPDGVCSKDDIWTDGTTPAASALDLHPDIVGTLSYLDDSTSSAIKSPGLFPLVTTNPPPSQPIGAGNLENANSNRNSHILLVTHQPLTDPEIVAIRTLIGSGQTLRFRPITVAYFPTKDADTQQQQLDDLQCAFNVVEPTYFMAAGSNGISSPPGGVNCRGLVGPPAASPNNPSGNALIVFSPFLPKHQRVTGFEDPSKDPQLDNSRLPFFPPPGPPVNQQAMARESKRFLIYWLFLLGGGNQNPLPNGDDQLIAVTARNVFLRRILKTELKL